MRSLRLPGTSESISLRYWRTPSTVPEIVTRSPALWFSQVGRESQHPSVVLKSAMMGPVVWMVATTCRPLRAWTSWTTIELSAGMSFTSMPSRKAMSTTRSMPSPWVPMLASTSMCSAMPIMCPPGRPAPCFASMSTVTWRRGTFVVCSPPYHDRVKPSWSSTFLLESCPAQPLLSRPVEPCCSSC